MDGEVDTNCTRWYKRTVIYSLKCKWRLCHYEDKKTSGRSCDAFSNAITDIISGMSGVNNVKINICILCTVWRGFLDFFLCVLSSIISFVWKIWFDILSCVPVTLCHYCFLIEYLRRNSSHNQRHKYICSFYFECCDIEKKLNMLQCYFNWIFCEKYFLTYTHMHILTWLTRWSTWLMVFWRVDYCKSMNSIPNNPTVLL